MNANMVTNFKEGKVRNLYSLSEMMVVETSNRVSAFDSVLKGEVPFKGIILQTISNKWMDMFSDVQNHIIGKDAEQSRAIVKALGYNDDGSTILVRKYKMFPIEFIVRGYYIPTSKSWDSYKKDCTIQGIELPAGLKESEKLPEPIFTPTTKGKSDKPITFEQMVEIVKGFLMSNVMMGDCNWDFIALKIADRLRLLALELYIRAAKYAESRGIILADTKLEFGFAYENDSFKLILCDEAFTPDSSRYWDASSYEVGKTQASMDKEFLRNFLRNEFHWTGLKDGPVPDVPEEVFKELSKIYNDILVRLFDIDVIEAARQAEYARYGH